MYDDDVVERNISQQDNLFMDAVALGCTPVFAIGTWECRCPGSFHGVSVSFPVLSPYSLAEARSHIRDLDCL